MATRGRGPGSQQVFFAYIPTTEYKQKIPVGNQAHVPSWPLSDPPTHTPVLGSPWTRTSSLTIATATAAATTTSATTTSTTTSRSTTTIATTTSRSTTTIATTTSAATIATTTSRSTTTIATIT